MVKLDPAKLSVPPLPIVFVRFGAQRGIWRRDPEGKETRLTFEEDMNPAVSVTGRIYFSRRTGTTQAIWSMDADGSKARQEVSEGFLPTVSGDSVAFLRKEAASNRLQLMLWSRSVLRVLAVFSSPEVISVSAPLFTPEGTKVLIGVASTGRDVLNQPQSMVTLRAYSITSGAPSVLVTRSGVGISEIFAYDVEEELNVFGIVTKTSPISGRPGTSQSVTSLVRLAGRSAAPSIGSITSKHFLDVTTSGQLLISASAKIEFVSKLGQRVTLTSGSQAVWLPTP